MLEPKFCGKGEIKVEENPQKVAYYYTLDGLKR